LELLINITILIAACACIGVAYTLYIHRDIYFPKKLNLPEKLTAVELGLLEGEIRNLTEVIIVSDIIEKPKNTLFASVEYNFNRNVQYKFLISKNRYSNEVNSYYLLFDAMTKATNCKNCLTISSLSMDWNTYPYIFYKTITNGKATTFAYRGTEINEGIADNYVLIAPALAETIANTVNQTILGTGGNANPQAPLFEDQEFDYRAINLN
jgi:hypothetical protein